MRWTRRIRILWQGTFLVLFLGLLLSLARGSPRALPAGLFRVADPRSAVSLALADGAFPPALLLGAALLLLTIVLGRFFCGWICPLGTLQQLSSWILTPRARRESMAHPTASDKPIQAAGAVSEVPSKACPAELTPRARSRRCSPTRSTS